MSQIRLLVNRIGYFSNFNQTVGRFRNFIFFFSIYKKNRMLWFLEKNCNLCLYRGVIWTRNYEIVHKSAHRFAFSRKMILGVVSRFSPPPPSPSVMFLRPRPRWCFHLVNPVTALRFRLTAPLPRLFRFGLGSIEITRAQT